MKDKCRTCKYYKLEFMECNTMFVCTGMGIDDENCDRYGNYRTN